MQAEFPLAIAIREFQGLKKLADRAMGQLSDNQLFSSPGEDDNSIALIMKHMSGNMRSRWVDFLTSDGEKPDRNRENEFVLTTEDSAASLRKHWDEGWSILFNAISPLQQHDLETTVTIRGEQLSVLQAIVRQLTHYAYHTGQIVYIAKYLTGKRWTSLSIPKGESEKFNRNHGSYPDRSR